MKKLLALVLALVMSMSLVTISNAAFKDADKISNKEAVDVMAAVGVLAGYDNGEFGATDTLTRAQACKIIAYLDLGGKTADAIKGTGTVFTDVKATSWYAGYVEYCAGAGYVAGVGGGKFDPEAKVTGVQFAKMLLCALGYKAEIEGYTGTDYTIAIARDANKNDLFDGLSIVTSANLTREQAAKMAFNALKATVVEYQGGTNVTTSDGTSVIVNATRNEVANKSYDYDQSVKDYDKNGTQQLCEKLYGKDLKKQAAASDDLGRPASKWTYKNDEVGTYGESADTVYTLTDTYKVESVANLLATLKDEDFTDNDGLKFKSERNTVTAILYVNGEKQNDDDGKLTDTVIKADSATAKAFANNAKGGVIVELYYSDEDVNQIDRVVVLNYSIAQIDDVSTKITKAQKDDGATCKIKVDGTYYTNDDVTGFNADTYVEDAYLLYVAKADKTEILASQIAKELKGKATAVKGDDARIDGTYYTTVDGITVKVSDEGSFYLNIAGQIAATDTTSKSDKYAYIYNVKMDADKINSNGVKATTFTAYYVTADGTKGSAVIASEKNTAGTAYVFEDTSVTLAEIKTENSTTTTTLKYTSGVIAYSINSDKELVYETAKDTIGNVNNLDDISKSLAQGTDSNTQFIFTWADGSTQKVATKVGYKNVDIDASSTGYITVTNSDGDIVYVFVAGENATVSSDAKLAVLLNTKATVTENEDGDEIYTYDVAVDGEETTLSFKDGNKLSDSKYVKGYVFAYEMDGDYAKVDATESAKIKGADLSKTAEKATKDYFSIGKDQYNLSDADAVYTITVEYKKSAKVNVDAKDFDATKNYSAIDSVTVSEGVSIDGKTTVDGTEVKGDYVTFTTDGDDLKVLFVYDFIG